MPRRPVDLPSLRTPRMTGDGPIIGSNNHNMLLSWLYMSLRDIQRDIAATWSVRTLIDLDIPWDDGTVGHMRVDIALFRQGVDPMLEVVDIGAIGPPTLVLELGDHAEAKPDTDDADLRTAKARWYETIGVEEYLVFDLALAVEGLRPMWVRRERRMDQRRDGEGRGFVPWAPDTRGRWVSPAFGIAFAPFGEGVRIWDPAGRPLLTRTEMQELRAAEDRVAAIEARLASEEAQLTLLRARRVAAEQARAEAERALAEEVRRRVAIEEELRRLREGRGE